MNQKLRFISIFFIAFFISSCTQKDASHIVKFEGESYQKNWTIKELNPELPSDWSSYNYLTFEIYASSTQPFFLNS